MIQYLGLLLSVWQRVPIYAVDRELMDMIAPPRRTLDPDCVSEIMRSLEGDFRTHPHNRDVDYQPYENLDKAELLWGQLSECGRDRVVTRGVYIQRLEPACLQLLRDRVLIRVPFADALGEAEAPNVTDLSGVPTLRELTDVLGGIRRLTKASSLGTLESVVEKHIQALPAGECIFICMERVVTDAKRINGIYGFKGIALGEIIDTITVSIILHELMHAYLNTESARYGELWGRLIEESLVTAYTLEALKQMPGMRILIKDLSELPLEYRASTYFDGRSLRELTLILEAWKANDARKCMRLCPPSGLLAHCGGKIEIWRSGDYLFDRFEATMSHPPEPYWRLLGEEILGRMV